MPFIIAIDIGTTHCKALTVSEEGKVILSLKKNTNTLLPQHGWVEQNPHEIFEKVNSLIKESIKNIGEGNISCISFSAAMHGIMAVDADGKPLTNIITWADVRSEKYAVEIRKSEKAKEIYAATGTPIHPMSPLCKISWIKNEQPEIFAKAAKFISIKEYIFYRLFNTYIIDYSIASATGLFDIVRLCWFEPALHAAGIAKNHLSQPVHVTHLQQNLSTNYLQRLGMNNPIQFVAGGNDGCCANLGCGATGENEMTVTVGTSGAVRRVTKEKKQDTTGKTFTYLLTENNYVSGGATNNGGNILEWFAEKILELPLENNADMARLESLAGAAPAGSEGLLFLPYLHGERAPVWDASACGVFFGVRSFHTKAHFTRAVFEGMCFALFDIYRLVDAENTVEMVYASGGFTQSAFWVQMVANIFSKKIALTNVADASALGAAFLGMLACGQIKNLSEVKKMIDTDKIFYPDSKTSELYKNLYKVYAELYTALKPQMAMLANMNNYK